MKWAFAREGNRMHAMADGVVVEMGRREGDFRSNKEQRTRNFE